MIEFFKKPYSYAAVFLVFITLFSTFVMLEAFVIPKKIDIPDIYPTNTPPTEMTTEQPTDTEESIYPDTDTPIITDYSYKDSGIVVEISVVRYYDTTCYIADIWVKDTLNLRTAFANDTFGKNITEYTSTMARRNNAIIAVNGDYYGFRNAGFVARNGRLYRTDARTGRMNDALAIGYDGTFTVYSEQSSDCTEIFENGAYHILTFGPALVNGGEIAISKNMEVDAYKASNQRTGIGYYEPHHYCMIVSDGRTDENVGLSLYEFAELFDELGCEVAYNLDGGGSTTMCFMGRIINVPTYDGIHFVERKVSDIVYIGY